MTDILIRAYRVIRKETEGLWSLVVLPVLLILAYVAVMANAPLEIATIVFAMAFLALAFVAGFVI